MAITTEHRRGRAAGQRRRRRPANHQRATDRVSVRSVRRHARQAERQARPGAPHRRPAHRRRGLRRVRRRRHRPGPARPGHDRGPRPEDADDPALAAQRGAVRVRRDGRGRAVAVLPAHDPAQPARARQGARVRAEGGRRARVLPGPPPRGRHDRGRRPARHARPPLLRHARADPEPRLRLAGLKGGDRARVGQLRHRPRGRQRPVRAELPVRRRADHVRPGCVLPLHGRVAGAAARADRHVHAQAVREPDRERLPLPRQPVVERRERVRARCRPTIPAGSACPSSPTSSSAG